MLNVTQTFLPPLEEYSKLLETVWESKWLTNRGVLVCELEQKLREYLGITHLLAVANGTIALQLAIKALRLKGEIITTPFSYVATVSSIVWEGCTPVFVDVEPNSLTINASLIEEAITDRTTAILATHVYGNPCDVEELDRIAKKHGLKIIYDAAHCFGVKYKGQSILNWGDVSILSFHATKLFHTGEGGAVICQDPELADTLFNHHNFGHNGPEEFFGLGINGKLSELNAAMGLAVFPYIQEIVAKRKVVCDTYAEAVKDNDGLRALQLRPDTDWNYSYFPVIFRDETSMLYVKQRLEESGIGTRRYFYPALTHLPYVTAGVTPVAEDLSRRVLCLPLSASMEDHHLRTITEVMSETRAASHV